MIQFFKPVKTKSPFPLKVNSSGKDYIFTEKDRGLDGFCDCTESFNTQDKTKQHRWLLLPQVEGQKQYLMCLDCHEFSHL